jgi:hypothetical protein
MSLPCFTTVWFATLPECIAHARKYQRSYSVENPARIGWVQDSQTTSDLCVRWYFVPRGSNPPEGFVLCYLTNELDHHSLLCQYPDGCDEQADETGRCAYPAHRADTEENAQDQAMARAIRENDPFQWSRDGYPPFR